MALDRRKGKADVEVARKPAHGGKTGGKPPDRHKDKSTGKSAKRGQGRGQALARRTTPALTDYAIKALKPGQKKADGWLPGGHGRLIARRPTAAQARDFVYRWRPDGDDRTVTLCAYSGPGSIAPARELAARCAKWVSEGRDPAVELEGQRDATRQTERERRERGSLANLLVDAYVGEHLKGRASASQVLGQFKLHIIDAFPDLAKKPACEVQESDAIDILKRMRAAGIERQCNMVRASARAAYSWVMKRERDWSAGSSEILFGVKSNPFAALPRKAEFDRARDRVMTDSELRRFIEMARDYSSPRKGKEQRLHGRVEVAIALQVRVLLAGPRTRQLLRATWDDYITQHGDEGGPERVLVLNDGKGKGPMREVLLPVSDRVAELIESLRQFNGSGQYIFSTTAGKRPIGDNCLSESTTNIARVIVPSGHVVASDIRRTAETRLKALGVGKEIRAELLSHGRANDVQARHYDRAEALVELADALRKWEAHLDDVLAGTAGGRVIRGRFGLRKQS
jgi:hypothetical protein